MIQFFYSCPPDKSEDMNKYLEIIIFSTSLLNLGQSKIFDPRYRKLFQTCKFKTLFRSDILASSFKCFEHDSPPVDVTEMFEDYCEDNDKNKYKPGNTLTSCCDCFM